MFDYRDLARLQRQFRFEIGPLRARGVPAILLGSATIVMSAGVARLLARNPSALVETIREATRFLGVLRGDVPRLKSGDDR
jgi:hypothetical protein